jgi:uncharacterized protein YndB with AHSA1/START domain
MNQALITKSSIKINASISKVWDILVNPEQTQKYMFGCRAVSDWKKGSSLTWEMNYEGKDLIAVKGEIVDIQPKIYLAYTTIDPNSNMPDIQENYLTVTYSLSEENGITNLIITQGDYSKVADGKKRYDETVEAGGWDSILVQIKNLAETY